MILNHFDMTKLILCNFPFDYERTPEFDAALNNYLDEICGCTLEESLTENQ